MAINKNFMDAALLYFHMKHDGDWDKIFQSLENKELIDIDKAIAYQKEYEGKYWTILDDEYPANKYGEKPAFVIMEEK